MVAGKGRDGERLFGGEVHGSSVVVTEEKKLNEFKFGIRVRKGCPGKKIAIRA